MPEKLLSQGGISLPAHNLSKGHVSEANKPAYMLIKAYSEALYPSQSQSEADEISHEELDVAY